MATVMSLYIHTHTHTHTHTICAVMHVSTRHFSTSECYLVNDQLDTQFFSMYLFQSSTCFEQPRAHHRENQLYQYNLRYISRHVGDRFVCRSERNCASSWSFTKNHNEITWSTKYKILNACTHLVAVQCGRVQSSNASCSSVWNSSAVLIWRMGFLCVQTPFNCAYFHF